MDTSNDGEKIAYGLGGGAVAIVNYKANGRQYDYLDEYVDKEDVPDSYGKMVAGIAK